MYSKTRHIGRQNLKKFPNPSNYQSIYDFLMNRQNTIRISENDMINARLWMHKCIPTLQNKANDSNSLMKLLPKIFYFCNNIKFHRNYLYRLAQNNLKDEKIEKLNDFEKVEILKSMVNFRHRENKEFKNKLRNSLLKNINQWSVSNNFFTQTKFINFIILDNQLSNSEKQGLLKMISAKFRKIPIGVLKDQQKNDIIFSKIYEMAKVYQLNLDPHFLSILGQSYSKMKFIPNDFQKKKTLQKLILNNQEQKKKFQSIFELIFQDFLLKNGYDFESNVVLCNNQYDILIKGKNKKKHKPFQKFRLQDQISQIQQFPKQYLKKLAQSSDVQWIDDPEPFQQKVIIDLHGPCHFIDSDNQNINNTITRFQEFRYEKLPLYGINRYNLVFYKQWEKKSKYPGIIPKFIEQVLEKSFPLNKINRESL